jgi:hypothetical protein
MLKSRTPHRSGDRLEQRYRFVGVAGLQPRPIRLQGRDRLAQDDAGQLAVVDDQNRRPHELLLRLPSF